MVRHTCMSCPQVSRWGPAALGNRAGLFLWLYLDQACRELQVCLQSFGASDWASGRWRICSLIPSLDVFSLLQLRSYHPPHWTVQLWWSWTLRVHTEGWNLSFPLKWDVCFGNKKLTEWFTDKMWVNIKSMTLPAGDKLPFAPQRLCGFEIFNDEHKLTTPSQWLIAQVEKLFMEVFSCSWRTLMLLN